MRHNITKILSEEVTKEIIWNIICSIYDKKIIPPESFLKPVEYLLKESIIKSKFWTGLELEKDQGIKIGQLISSKFLFKVIELYYMQCSNPFMLFSIEKLFFI